MTKLADRVLDTSSAVGTGTFTLNNVSIAGARTFADALAATHLTDGCSTVICIQGVDVSGNPSGQWEVCETVYDHATATVTRGTLVSSSTGARVDFAVGSKQVMLTMPASRTVQYTYASDGVTPVGLAGILVTPSGGDDSITVQAAANISMANGLKLMLGPGVFNFNTAGIQCNSGPDIGSGVFAGQTYKGLEVCGMGVSTTTININGAFAAFRWHSGALTGNVLMGMGISNMSIIGTGINSGSSGLQFGGVSTIRSDLCENIYIRDILIDNVTSGIICDDVSVLAYSNLSIQRAKYMWEFGYNCDDIKGSGHYGKNISNINNVSTTFSTATNSFVVSATVAGLLQVGYSINAPGYFPKQTYVGSIVGNTITAVDYAGGAVNAIANGSPTTVIFTVGRIFNYGARLLDTAAGTLYPQYGSPFVSPYWSGSYAAARGRINANMHDHSGMGGQIERVSDIGGASHFQLKFTIYQERANEGYLIGDAGSTLQARQINIDNCYIGAPNRLLAAWVLIPVAQADFILTVKNCHTDASDMSHYWLDAPVYGVPKLTWECNSLPSTGIETTRMGAASIYASLPTLAISNSMYVGSAKKGEAIMVKSLGGTLAWINYGLDGLSITLSAASTISNPADYDYACTGKKFNIYAVQNGTGGYTLTLGTKFVDISGAAFGTIAAGAANQKLMLAFTWDGTYYRANNNAAWL